MTIDRAKLEALGFTVRDDVEDETVIFVGPKGAEWARKHAAEVGGEKPADTPPESEKKPEQ